MTELIRPTSAAGAALSLALPASAAPSIGPSAIPAHLERPLSAQRVLQRFPLLAPFASRSYAFLWGGNFISLAGDQFQTVALAVLALDLTASTAVLGAVLGAQAIPRALFMLVGGVAADRFKPRTVMLAANALQGVIVALLAAAIASGALQQWHLYAYAVAS